MLNIAVLVSGGGTNLQALIDAEKAGKIENGRIAVVVASRPGVYALERAKNAGIEGVVLARKDVYKRQFQITAIYETKEYFYMYFGEDNTYYIKKDGFTQGDADSFRAFMKEKIGKKMK